MSILYPQNAVEVNPMVSADLIKQITPTVPKVLEGKFGGFGVTPPSGRHQYVITNDRTYNAQNRIIRIDIPTNMVLDFASARLELEAQTTFAAPATWASFPNYFSTIISRITLYQANQPVDEEREYGHLLAQHYTHERINQWTVTNHSDEYGIGTPVQRLAWGPNWRKYYVTLKTGWADKNFNMMAFNPSGASNGAQQMWFEVELYDPQTALESDSAVAVLGYNIRNVRFIVDELPSLPLAIRMHLSNPNSHPWIYQTSEIALETIVTNQTAVTVEVPARQISIDSVALIQLADTFKITPTNLNRLTLSNYNNLTEAQLEVAGRNFPALPIVCTNANNENELFWYYKRARHASGNSTLGNDKDLMINRNQYYFGNVCYVEIPCEQNHADGDLNPICAGPSGKVFVRLRWAGAVTARLYFIINYHKVFRIQDGKLLALK